MGLIRAFIALDIPVGIQQRIAQETAPLARAAEGTVRWVAPENIHLTIKFLGDVSPNQLELLTHTLSTEAAALPAFNMEIGGLGCFPNPRRPRVIWVGIQAPASLQHLVHSVEHATGKIGYPPEEKTFSPHLTIGRVKPHAENIPALRTLLEKMNVPSLGTASVSALHLFRSELKPGGAVYSLLFSAPLGGDTTAR